MGEGGGGELEGVLLNKSAIFICNSSLEKREVLFEQLCFFHMLTVHVFVCIFSLHMLSYHVLFIVYIVSLLVCYALCTLFLC